MLSLLPDGGTVLITGDGDRSVPSELRRETVERICESPKISMWYTQNYDDNGSHPKLRPYPIGLDLHTARARGLDTPERIVATMRQLAIDARGNKDPRIFCDVSASTRDRFGGQRKRVAELLHGKPHAELLASRLPVEEVWRHYAQHEFVVSPPGNGRDCHRTWEVILLGSVPVVLSSHMDSVYASHRVIIVNAWEEISDPGCVEAWRARLRDRNHSRSTPLPPAYASDGMATSSRASPLRRRARAAQRSPAHA